MYSMGEVAEGEGGGENRGNQCRLNDVIILYIWFSNV